MVPEAVMAIAIIGIALFTVLRKGKSSSEMMIGYLLFMFLLALVQIGAHKAILLAMSCSPFIYILNSSGLNTQKTSNTKSSSLEKVVLYLSISPFFGLLFLDINLEFFDKINFSSEEIFFIPEVFLLFVTIVTFLELIILKGDDHDF